MFLAEARVAPDVRDEECSDAPRRAGDARAST